MTTMAEPSTDTPAPTAEPVPVDVDVLVVTHRVLRPFHALDLLRDRGELLDASGWRTTATLVRSRYLAPIGDEEAPDARACSLCSRAFLDAGSLAGHAVTSHTTTADRLTTEATADQPSGAEQDV